MAYKKYNSANNAFATLAFPIDDTDVTCVLQWKFWRMPTANFILKVTHTAAGVVTGRENIYITTRAGANCTGLIRAYEPVPTDDDATTNIQQALNFDAGDLCEVVVSREVIKDIQDEVSLKLPIIGWLNTWYWVNKVKEIVPWSWDEALRNLSSWSSIWPTELIRSINPSTRDYKETPYSALLTDMQAWSASKEIAWEALIPWDIVCFEEQTNFSLALWEVTARNQATIWWLKLNEAKIGDVVWNTKRSQKIVWNWVSATTIKIWLRKNGAPVDNVTIRIETDDWTWKPSGSLAHANATWTVAWSWLSASLTGMSEQTVTFAGAFTLTDKTPYHVVIWRSAGIDATNYYFLAHINTTAFWFTTSLNNGTVWWTPATTIMMCIVFAWSYTKIVVRTRANDAYHVFILWMCLSTTALYQSASIQWQWASSVLSWLSKDATYFLSNTPWVISTTAGTNIVVAWQSDSTWTWFTLTDFRWNEIYTSSQVIYTNGGWTSFDLSFRATRRWQYMWVSSGWSGLYHNYSMKNWVSTWASWTVFTLNPWDLYQASEYTSNIHATVTLYEMMWSIKQSTI